jgi:phage gpG-like protein
MVEVDTREFKRRVESLARAMPGILRGVGEELQYMFQAFAEEHFTEGGDGPNTGRKLRVQSGDLTRSLIPGQEGSLSKITVTPDGRLSVKIGSSLVYGRLHETGGFVRSKGRMHKYFFARFYETRDEFYLHAALAVLRDGGINIPARPWFSPAEEQMRRTGRKMAEQRIRKEFAKAFR